MPATVRNAAREKLDQGQLSLGVGARMTRSVEIADAARPIIFRSRKAGSSISAGR